MARKSLQSAAEEEEDVNITPLLDIVFIMLIFFIVTSTFIKEPGVDVIRPVAETQVEQKPAVLVAVDENDQIWINKEQVELSEVRYKVEELRRETPKGNAVVQADAGAKSEITLDVLQQVKDAGISDVALSTVAE
ncbi:biopolymer transporter ExbD [Parvularcula sp. ZS-1/3]|uniref:Biopolymer transporter ExbD n=1 Tax=Parvularcula mediterranea TaxID=2732508 RepID=A0A7Y3RJH9_9PROT|nr:biopolymer transporter ExbD [Parvularcula mediterranea]NNU15208.1 biopolymer transporter ExbD [Parvularcula mediterranea]